MPVPNSPEQHDQDSHRTGAPGTGATGTGAYSTDGDRADAYRADVDEADAYRANSYRTGPNALPPDASAPDGDNRAAHNDLDRLYAPYEYAFVRVVPYAHRGEYINAGVIVFCRPQRFLAARIKLDTARVAALAPQLDLGLLRQTLALTPRICAGEGPIGKLGQAESFHWLVAPHNTVVQASPVHCGVCADPAVALENLLTLVPGDELAAGQYVR